MYCWRTSAQSLALENLPEPAVTWPKSGMTRAGRAYELPTFTPPTAENASSSLLPTPQARDGDNKSLSGEATAFRRMYKEGRRNLDDAIALLPTPTSRDWKDTGDFTPHPEKVKLAHSIASLGLDTASPSDDGNESSDAPLQTQLF
jgi:hypothetical protein